jgi:hypothetical protein
MFTSAAVGAGFALAYVPNIELITAIVFAAGVYLGLSWGSVVGAVSMLIFSGVNPMGSGFNQSSTRNRSGHFNGSNSCYRRSAQFLDFFHQVDKTQIVFLGISGGLLTFIYDSLTH